MTNIKIGKRHKHCLKVKRHRYKFLESKIEWIILLNKQNREKFRERSHLSERLMQWKYKNDKKMRTAQFDFF